MVNVTKSNFLEKSDEILGYLPNAAYVSIDLEMSGISIPRSGPPSREDEPEERYQQRLKEVPERYSIIQVGIALFHENPKYRRYQLRRTQKRMEMAGQGIIMGDDEIHCKQVDGTNFRHDIPRNHAAAVADDDVDDDDDDDDDDDEQEPAEFLSRRYNFFLFPPPFSHRGYTREITLNPASIAFLNEHSMDYNTWVKEGIPFVTGDTAQFIIHRYKDKQFKKDESSNNTNKPNRERIKPTKQEDIAWLTRVMASVREWLDSECPLPPGSSINPISANGTIALSSSSSTATSATVNDEHVSNSMLLPSCNSYRRRLLYESIDAEYPSLFCEKAPHDQIRVFRLNPQERKAREERLKRQEWESLLRDHVGFWRVFEALSKACRGEFPVSGGTNNGVIHWCDMIRGDIPKKFIGSCVATTTSSNNIGSRGSNRRRIPLVVHNGLMDLLFLLTHFHNPTLPSSYLQMKQLISQYFPIIYDTKVMSTEYSSAEIRNGKTALGDLFRDVCVDVDDLNASFVDMVDGDASESIASAHPAQAHEASYDAYMTGAVFHGLSKRIMKTCRIGKQHGRVAERNKLGSFYFLADSFDEDARDLFGRNKVYLMQTFYNIDLEKETKFEPLSHGMSPTATFRVSGVDKSVLTRDVARAIRNFVDSELMGSADDIGSIDSTAATAAGLGGNAFALGQRVDFDIVWVDDNTFFVATRRPDESACLSNYEVADTSSSSPEEIINSFQERHGHLIREALKRGFGKNEIVTLKEHLARKRVALSSVERQEWMGSFSNFAASLPFVSTVSGVMESLLLMGKKRKNVNVDSPSKRQKLGQN